MPLHAATHPLIAHKMNVLRDAKTSTSDFRGVLREITFYLGYEASRDLKTVSETVTTPMAQPFTGSKIGESIAIIPILRAGLGMCDAMLELFPRAAVHHIGMYRTKDSLIPVQYYNRLPRGEACDVAYVVDPCIATSNTIHAVVNILKRWGARRVVVISAIGARAGVERLLEEHPDVEIHIGAVDEVLSDNGMILPGIGDAGDRQFGTHHDQEPTVLPAEPISPPASASKRKRHDA
jgi:uracil phosphoribosyltransferase